VESKDPREMGAVHEASQFGHPVERTPDGQGIELDKVHTPNAIRFGPVDAPVNTLGIRRVMFAVDDIDAVVARMRPASESSLTLRNLFRGQSNGQVTLRRPRSSGFRD